MDDLSYLKPGEKTKAFYGCATADSTVYITEDELVKTGRPLGGPHNEKSLFSHVLSSECAGLMEGGKSLMTSIFPGESVYVTFYTNSDFTGYDYTFNSNYHHEMTQFHFKGTTYVPCYMFDL